MAAELVLDLAGGQGGEVAAVGLDPGWVPGPDQELATVPEPTETAMDPVLVPEVVQGQAQGQGLDLDPVLVPLSAGFLAAEPETDWEPQGPDGGTDWGTD